MSATLIALALVAAQQKPATPTIAFIPGLNLSGEKNKDLMRRQAEKVSNFLTKEFTKRGYSVIPEATVNEAIKTLKIDLTDEEEYRKANFFTIAKALSADYIYVPLIVNSEQKQQDRDLYTDREGRTDVKTWFLDVKEEKAIISAKLFIGRSGGLRFNLRPSDRQVQAAENAVSESLKEVWKAIGAR
jgi:2-keto-3-deoxy-galactonokinase